LGALPDSVSFPSAEAELLFAPLEAVDFAVDACVNVRWLPNRQAHQLVRKQVVKADQLLEEELAGEHGASARSEQRPHAARALEEYLQTNTRPPLLHATIGFAIGATSEEELEARVAQLRDIYSPVRLH